MQTLIINTARPPVRLLPKHISFVLLLSFLALLICPLEAGKSWAACSLPEIGVSIPDDLKNQARLIGEKS